MSDQEIPLPPAGSYIMARDPENGGVVVRTRVDPVRQALFLRALARNPIVGSACREAGITLTDAYQLRARNSKFRAAWESALTAGVDRLEEIAIKRAEDGSDQVLMMLLRAHRPEKYGTKVDVTVGRRAEIVVDLVPAGVGPSPDAGGEAGTRADASAPLEQGGEVIEIEALTTSTQ